MAKRGDCYEVELIASHLGWGEYRHTNTRPTVQGEGYIKIPALKAKSFKIYNSNLQGDELGINIFNCSSSDGLFRAQLKAQGSSEAGNVYAKQFAQNGNLRGIGRWYKDIGADIGDYVSVKWVSDTDIEISLIKR